MNNQLNKENLLKIINSDCVPADEHLFFDIEDAEISIRKVYINEENEKSGNTILISKENLQICIIADESEIGLLVLFNENETSFNVIYADSPKYIIEFVNEIWSKIMIDMQERENAWNGIGNELKLEDFKLQFGNHKVPNEMLLLFEFENKYGSENYSECFYLNLNDKSGLKSWSEDEKFLNSFIEFACANGSGSTYAYWLINDEVENCPIVVFGDEGGIHIVANSTKELIQLLTYDIEIMVDHEGATFYKDEDEYEKSENKKEFTKWVKENFGMKVIKTDEETEDIINNAQEKYQQKLNEFLISFGIEI